MLTWHFEYWKWIRSGLCTYVMCRWSRRAMVQNVWNQYCTLNGTKMHASVADPGGAQQACAPPYFLDTTHWTYMLIFENFRLRPPYFSTFSAAPPLFSNPGSAAVGRTLTGNARVHRRLRKREMVGSCRPDCTLLKYMIFNPQLVTYGLREAGYPWDS